MTIKELAILNKTSLVDLLGTIIKNSKTNKELIISGNKDSIGLLGAKAINTNTGRQYIVGCANNVIGIYPNIDYMDYYTDIKALISNQMLDNCSSNSTEDSRIIYVTDKDLKHVYLK